MNILTLNHQRLEEVIQQSQKFRDNPNVESDIEELLNAYEEISDAVEQVKESFKEKFSEGLIENSIEGDSIKVVISSSGSKYIMENKEKIDPEFLELKLNTSAVNAFVEQYNRTPAGILQKEVRSLSCRITQKNGSHE